jgi:hypothetical protein
VTHGATATASQAARKTPVRIRHRLATSQVTAPANILALHATKTAIAKPFMRCGDLIHGHSAHTVPTKRAACAEG